MNSADALRAELWQLAANAELAEDQLIQQALDVLGPHLELGQAAFFEHQGKDGGHLCTAEWRGSGVRTLLGATLPALAPRWGARRVVEADEGSLRDLLTGPEAERLLQALVALELKPSLLGGLCAEGRPCGLVVLRPRQEDRAALVPVVADGLSILSGALGRVRLRKRLAIAEQRYHDLAQQVPQGIFEVDERGQFTFANRALLDRFGYSLADIGRGLSMFDFLAPEHRARGRERFARIAAGEVLGPTEYPLVTRDGVRRAVVIDSSRMVEGGAVVGLRGVVSDVTEHHETAERLHASEDRLDAILGQVPVLIWSVDQALEVSSALGAALSLLGLVPAEVTGMSLEAFVGAHADPAPFAAQHRRALAGETVDFEYEFRGIAWRCHLKPFRNAAGEIVGALGVATDTTEQRRVETVRAHLEDQVRHAQKLDSLAVLAGGIAHDFNNLLGVIVSNADLARQEMPVGSDLAQSLGDVLDAARGAAGLVNQMLAFAGKGAFELALVDLSGMLREMAPLLEATVSKKTRLVRQLADGLPGIEADPTQVRQVVVSLVTNAVEALPASGGEIRLSTGAVELAETDLRQNVLADGLRPGRYAFFEVADNGAGMDEETRRRIFDPFFSTKFTGRGLGLASVLGTVRSHKGGIRVRTAPGLGSSFRVFFPALAAAPVTPADRPRSVTGERREGRVLLVDDEAMIRAVGRRMLERLGFTVVEADNGRRALDLFKQQPEAWSCVLLDYTMPELNGEEALVELRKIRPDVPVVITSGFGGAIADRLRRSAGFLHKPFRLAELIAEIDTAMGRPTQ